MLNVNTGSAVAPLKANTGRKMNNPSDAALFSVLDAAEQYIYEKVRTEVREAITKRLSEEFNELIQDAVTSAFAGIVFKIHSERDVISRTEEVRVLVEWVKSKEKKKEYRTKTVMECNDIG